MTEHVHEWARTLSGSIRCAVCGKRMSQAEELLRLNATERLSADEARYIGRKGPRGEEEIPRLMDYADIREGK